jgi:hypothetical protein
MVFTRMGVEVVDEGASARLSNLVVGSRLLAWIKIAQLVDPECTKIRQLLRHKGFALRMLTCWVAHPFQMSVCRKVKD